MILIFSILASFGVSILFVEKGDDWPVSKYKKGLSLFLDEFHPKAREMLDCTICTSFWAALIMDAILFIFSGGNYFLWPVTGFAASGFAWIVYQLLEALDNNGE